jgi:hypothetical protein
MKTINKRIVLIMGICFGFVFSLKAQDKTATGSLNSALDLYVFPAKDQSPDQQSKEENECYTWAINQSGVDPLNMPEVQAEQVQSGPTGAAVVGSARGAATGAAIGAIAGDAGKGAAIGAVGGAVRGHRAGRRGKAIVQAGNNQEAAQTQANMINSFKKAYSACLEGKGYTVK